ncbi:glycosyltransferase family 4 protein [Bacteroidota bacterium]
MRIAVNTRLLIPNQLEGLGRFTYESLKRITESYPEHEFVFLFDRPFSDEFVFGANVNPIAVGPPARHPVLWHVWFELSLPKVLSKIKPDLFLSPDGFLSLKTDVLSLPVIHDLNFVHNPKDLARSHSWFYNRYFPKYAAKAARIATVSEFSKQDICTQYGVSSDKIDVVYNGVAERFKPSSAPVVKTTRNKWSDGKPYFIYIGAIHARKNIVRLLQAYDLFRQCNSEGQQLILVGNRKWWSDEMEKTLQNLSFKEDVIFTGRISDNDLESLLGAATANVYVSTFEGFGIPIIESFQAQVPVITSNTTSMPEIAQGAALVVDPFSVEAIAEAMIKIVSNDALRTTLVEKGVARAKDFTWERTATLLWNSVEKAIEER